MNFGFDFDKIFIEYPPFVPDKLIDFLYKKKSNGVLKYRIPSRPEQLLRLLTHYPIFRKPIRENLVFVKNLKEQNNAKYYLISSRFRFLKKMTEQTIRKNNLNLIFDDMFFNFQNQQPHIFKSEIIKKLKLDRYIDDDLALLKFLSQKNKGILFYWLNKKGIGQLSENLFAITKLADFLK